MVYLRVEAIPDGVLRLIILSPAQRQLSAPLNSSRVLLNRNDASSFSVVPCTISSLPYLGQDDTGDIAHLVPTTWRRGLR